MQVVGAPEHGGNQGPNFTSAKSDAEAQSCSGHAVDWIRVAVISGATVRPLLTGCDGAHIRVDGSVNKLDSEGDHDRHYPARSTIAIPRA